MKKLSRIGLCAALLMYICNTDNAFAVPPPDFIIQVASQFGSFFAVAFALSAGIFSIFLQFVRGAFINNKVKFWLVSLVILIAIS